MGNDYQKNKDHRPNSGPHPDALGQAVNDVLQEFIVVTSLGIWGWIKRLSKNSNHWQSHI